MFNNITWRGDGGGGNRGVSQIRAFVKAKYLPSFAPFSDCI